MSFFHDIFDYLKHCTQSPEISVPNTWLGAHQKKGVASLPAHDFFYGQFKKVLEQSNKENFLTQPLTSEKNWTDDAITYNLFIRFFSAFDHDQDGKLGEGKSYLDNDDGIRESGTLLKTIALLPYLKSLGVNTIHFLPLTPIGQHGRKGDLGSPYAIKNHFAIDPNIVDPFVPFNAEQQLIALIEACHALGFRVVMEFILRTTARDADWVAEQPEWYYWIDRENTTFGPPDFSEEELKKIDKVPVGKGTFIPPDTSFKNQFFTPPAKSSIHYENQYIANQDGKELTIPSAFADWPPNDPQPPWTDVTYLRFYDDAGKKFNYIAYNTIRYYDPQLSSTENINSPLWERLTDIIPYYQQKFGIDGVMIDMGHALPEDFKTKMIEKARKVNPQFAFWDEKFDEGGNLSFDYDAIIGNSWYLAYRRLGWKYLVNQLSSDRKLHFFACAETHNSPRFGFDNARRKKQFWLLLNLLTKGMPFIHQGFELNEWIPVNTGLNIQKNLQKKLSDTPLPLFNKTSLNWNPGKNIIDFIVGLNKFRKNNTAVFKAKTSVLVMDEKNKMAVLKKENKSDTLYFLFNFDTKKTKNLPLNTLIGTNLIEIDIEGTTFIEKSINDPLILKPSGFYVFGNGNFT